MNTPTDSPRTEDLDKQLLTEMEACAYLRVSKRNLYCWRVAGLIPYFKLGKARWITGCKPSGEAVLKS